MIKKKDGNGKIWKVKAKLPKKHPKIFQSCVLYYVWADLFVSKQNNSQHSIIIGTQCLRKKIKETTKILLSTEPCQNRKILYSLQISQWQNQHHC